MPEMLEVEAYRLAAEPVVGRTISTVSAPDQWYVKGGSTPSQLVEMLPGKRVIAVRRIGKLMLVDTDGPVIGLRYGMTGRILVDGGGPIDRLEYSSDRNDPAWDRFALGFEGGGSLVLRDPRRLGGVELDPDEDRLGPDAGVVGLAAFRKVLSGSSLALKARLLDQNKIAGLGNLLVDDMLYRAAVAPDRPVNTLAADEVARLHKAMRRTLAILGRRGGSHTGDLQPVRMRGGHCPKDGTELRRDDVGGRTTYWCPLHQT